MRFVAVEFDNAVNNTHVKGYLRIPENFDPSWHLGFRNYLVDKYKIKNGTVNIYGIPIHLTSDNMGNHIAGYSNMEDDFNLALRSNTYYPSSDSSDRVRRQWAMLDPMSPDFYMKER